MGPRHQDASRHGPTVLFVLLLGFMLGGPAPATGISGHFPAGFKQFQPAKAPPAARLSRRVSDPLADPADLPTTLGCASSTDTCLVSIGPAEDLFTAPATAPGANRASPFRARAPPAV